VERTGQPVPYTAHSYHPVGYSRVGSRSRPPRSSLHLHQPDLCKERSFRPVSYNQGGSHCMFDSRSLVAGRRILAVGRSRVAGRRILAVGRSRVVGNNIEPWRVGVCRAQSRQRSQQP
jgi:hypothetical protein